MLKKIISGVIVLIVIVGGLVVWGHSNKKTPTTATEKATSQSQSKTTMSSEPSDKSIATSQTEQTSQATTTDVQPSQSSSVVANGAGHESEEKQIAQQSSQAGQIMTVAAARQAMRQAGIDDGAFSNNDINGYIIKSNAAKQDFISYLKSQGF